MCYDDKYLIVFDLDFTKYSFLMITHTLNDPGLFLSNIRDHALLKLLEKFFEKGQNWFYGIFRIATCGR